MSVIVKTSGGVDLARSTQATASEDKIIEGYTAWVNGEKLTGTAKEGKTVVQEKSGVYSHTFTFEGTPKAILAEFGYNGTVAAFGTFMKILNKEYKQSSGSPSQQVSFGNNSLTMNFNDAMSSSYTPYFKATAIY